MTVPYLKGRREQERESGIEIEAAGGKMIRERAQTNRDQKSKDDVMR